MKNLTFEDILTEAEKMWTSMFTTLKNAMAAQKVMTGTISTREAETTDGSTKTLTNWIEYGPTPQSEDLYLMEVVHIKSKDGNKETMTKDRSPLSTTTLEFLEKQAADNKEYEKAAMYRDLAHKISNKSKA